MTTAAQVPVARPGCFSHLSFSAISLFQQCPLRFKFRYIDNLPEPSVAASLVFGSAIHSAVQFHFEQLLIGQAPPGLDFLLDVFQEAWRSRDGPEIRYKSGEDFNALCRLADRMLVAFQKSDVSVPKGQIIGVEEELRGQLVPGCPDLLARVDLMIDGDDALHVIDLKTARSQWSQEHVEESANQLLIYSELAKPLADGKPVKLSFAVLTKTKVPDMSLHQVEADPRQVNRTKGIVERIWQAIQAGHFYPNPSPMNCPGCPYRKPCRAWDG
jgi:CRISPR/Cas system-associated exonuclease Cas4 (RecB family)